MNKLLVKLVMVFSLLSIVFLSSTALAIKCSDCSGSNTLSSQQAIECGTSCASGNDQTPAQAKNQINNTIASVINVLSAVAGIGAVVMIIIGGFRYITSGGSSEKITSAKNTIIYAIVGLIVVALAQVIVHFVLQKATCVDGKTTTGQKCTP